jgi:hypothetical protein
MWNPAAWGKLRTGGRSVAGAAGLATVTLAVAAVMAAVMAIAPREVEARPAFAAQTGKACGACHTAPPKLNATGKRFKAKGNKF